MSKEAPRTFEQLAGLLGSVKPQDLTDCDTAIKTVADEIKALTSQLQTKMQSLLSMRKLIAFALGDESLPAFRADGGANGQKRGAKPHKQKTDSSTPPTPISSNGESGLADKILADVVMNGPASYTRVAERIDSDRNRVQIAVKTHAGWFETSGGGVIKASQTGWTEHKKRSGVE